jgi:hypothetical protein
MTPSADGPRLNLSYGMGLDPASVRYYSILEEGAQIKCKCLHLGHQLTACTLYIHCTADPGPNLSASCHTLLCYAEKIPDDDIYLLVLYLLLLCVLFVSCKLEDNIEFYLCVQYLVSNLQCVFFRVCKYCQVKNAFLSSGEGPAVCVCHYKYSTFMCEVLTVISYSALLIIQKQIMIICF